MSGSNSSAPGSSAPVEASPLSFTVHSLPVPQLEGEVRRRTALGRLKMMAVLAVCAAPVIASYFTYFVIRPEGRNNYSELIAPPRPMPESLTLTDTQGKAVQPSSLQGQWILAVVADAACDATCERNLYLQRQLRETLGREKERLDKVWFVTDGGVPRREVEQAVSTGTPAVVLHVPRQQLAKWLSPAADRSLAQHLYVIDPMGQWMMRVPADPDPSKLKKDIERLLRASASWDQPGR
jgi:hypothetical protein